MKIKVKKTLLKRKVDGATLSGYYGRVITNGTKTVEEILKTSTHGSTLDYREAKLAVDMMIDGISDAIKQGYIVDLGTVGRILPAVNGPWKQDPDDLSLSDMKPKVNYRPSEDIASAVRGASLVWTTEQATEENSDDDAGDDITDGGSTDDGGSGSSTDDPGEVEP